MDRVRSNRFHITHTYELNSSANNLYLGDLLISCIILSDIKDQVKLY